MRKIMNHYVSPFCLFVSYVSDTVSSQHRKVKFTPDARIQSAVLGEVLIVRLKKQARMQCLGTRLPLSTPHGLSIHFIQFDHNLSLLDSLLTSLSFFMM